MRSDNFKYKPHGSKSSQDLMITSRTLSQPSLCSTLNVIDTLNPCHAYWWLGHWPYMYQLTSRHGIGLLRLASCCHPWGWISITYIEVSLCNDMLCKLILTILSYNSEHNWLSQSVPLLCVSYFKQGCPSLIHVNTQGLNKYGPNGQTAFWDFRGKGLCLTPILSISVLYI